jgi:hypothetical protein
VIAEGMKPSLYKAGAEKMAFLFRLRMGELKVDEREIGGGHREFIITTPFLDKRGKALGYGLGSCTTMESKYRWRKAERKCPACGNSTVIKGKEEFGGGWLCWTKKGGCGAKFMEDDPAIMEQQVGKIENEDLADVYNTVLKIAKKRSYIDGVIAVCACSDFFTQDVEDLPENQKAELREQAKSKAEAKKPDAHKVGDAKMPPHKVKEVKSAVEMTARDEKIEAIKDAILNNAPENINVRNYLTVQCMKHMKRTWDEFVADADDEMLNKALFDFGVPNTW